MYLVMSVISLDFFQARICDIKMTIGFFDYFI